MHTCVIARWNIKVSDCNHGLPFQEEILKEMEQYLERHRSQFPRLYFLSNADLVEMVGISRNPQALVPFARKCFPGITSLTFTLPPGMGGLNSALDFALNSRQLFFLCVCWGGFTGCGFVISVRAFLSCFGCLFVHLAHADPGIWCASDGRIVVAVFRWQAAGGDWALLYWRWWQGVVMVVPECCGALVTSCRWWLSVVVVMVVTEFCCNDGGDRVLLWWWWLSGVVHKWQAAGGDWVLLWWWWWPSFVVMTVVTECCYDGGDWAVWCTSDTLQVVTECCCGAQVTRCRWWQSVVAVHR